MKKTLLLSGVLLALSASMALAAGGVNFNWGGAAQNCYPEGPLTNKTFACNSNTLSGATMVGSYATANAIGDFVGIEVVVDIQASGGSLPDWWQYFNGGACRALALSTSGDFTLAAQTLCTDVFSGLASGGTSAYQTSTTAPPVPSGLPNAARLKVALALASSVGISGGVEYYGWRATMNGSKTMGTGVQKCLGCGTQVTLVENEIKAAGLTYQERLTAPLQNNCITWQGASGIPCGATPTHNSTWGQVKSLYR